MLLVVLIKFVVNKNSALHTLELSDAVYTGPDKFLNGTNLSRIRCFSFFGTVQVLEGNSTAIYNKIFTVSCKQFGQVKKKSVPKFPRTRVNEVLKHIKLCCKFIMGQKLQRSTELLNKEMSG